MKIVIDLIVLVVVCFSAKWGFEAGKIVLSREKILSKKNVLASIGLLFSVMLFISAAIFLIAGNIPVPDPKM